MKKIRLYKAQKDNCWQIALCNLMNLPPRKVPHFVKKYNTDFVEETRKWLNKKGKTITYVPLSSFLDTGTKYNHNLFPQGKCIACVNTNGKDTGHAVLMMNGQLHEKDNKKYDSIDGYFIVHNL